MLLEYSAKRPGGHSINSQESDAPTPTDGVNEAGKLTSAEKVQRHREWLAQFKAQTIQTAREIKEQLHDTRRQVCDGHPDLEALANAETSRCEASLALESMVEGRTPDETWPAADSEAFNEASGGIKQLEVELNQIQAAPEEAERARIQLLDQIDREYAAREAARERALAQDPDVVEAQSRVKRLEALATIDYYFDEIDMGGRLNFVLNELGPRVLDLLTPNMQSDPDSVMDQAKARAKLPEFESWLDEIRQANERIRRDLSLDKPEPAAMASEDRADLAVDSPSRATNETGRQPTRPDRDFELQSPPVGGWDPEIEKLLDEEAKIGAEGNPPPPGPEQQAWANLESTHQNSYDLGREQARVEMRIFRGNPETENVRKARHRMYRANRTAMQAPIRTQEAIDQAIDNHEEMQMPLDYLNMVEADAKKHFNQQIMTLLKEAARGKEGHIDFPLLRSIRGEIENSEPGSKEQILALLPPATTGRQPAQLASKLNQALEVRDWYASERQTALSEIRAIAQTIEPEILERPGITKLQQRQDELRLKALEAKEDHERINAKVISESPLFPDWTRLGKEVALAKQAVIQAQTEIDRLAGITGNEAISSTSWRPPAGHERFATGHHCRQYYYS